MTECKRANTSHPDGASCVGEALPTTAWVPIKRYVLSYRGDEGTVVSEFELRPDALNLLCEEASGGLRIYELMRIQRPGDIWNYIWVAMTGLHGSLQWRVERAREEALPRHARQHPWPDAMMPYVNFDGLFYVIDWEPNPLDEAWDDIRESQEIRFFAMDCFKQACEVQDGLRKSRDPLIQRELELIKTYSHPQDFAHKPCWQRTFPGERCKTRASHTPAFYQRLRDILQQNTIRSVAYRGGFDFQTLATLCRIQLARVDDRTPPWVAMFIAALSEAPISFDAAHWGCDVRFALEGLPRSDLYIENGRCAGASLKELVEKYARIESKWMLSARDQGQIAGYRQEVGEGWYSYERLFAQREDELE